jgi:hypothetical protein
VRLLLIALFLLPIAGIHAQELFSKDDDHVFHAGLYLGINFCQVDGDYFFGYNKIGGAGGAQVYARLNRFMHASIGIGYAQKGCREANAWDYYLDLKYAEMPLMLHIFPGGRLHFSAGISYARLISSTEDAYGAMPFANNPDQYPFSKTDWSGIGGMSYRVYGNWFLNGQFQYTIGSMRRLEDAPPGYAFSGQQNNVVTLRLLYIIPSGAAL